MSEENRITVNQMQQVAVDQLAPYANNARTHSPEQIKKLQASLREFGFVNPLIIDENHNVLAGHGRLEAAKAEGMSKVPCVYVNDMTEAQKKAYILADNRMALDAGWDEDLLKVEIESLQEMAFDIELTGFDAADLAKLFPPEAEDDGFDQTEALKKASFVKRGDLWHVGKHVLCCGDATDEGDVAYLLGETKADLALTDPPFGVSAVGRWGLEIQGDQKSGRQLYDFLLAAFQNMKDHMQEDASIYCFHSDMEGLAFRKAFADAGFHLESVCVWAKNYPSLGYYDYLWIHEPILYGYIDGSKHHWYADRKQKTVWKFDKASRNSEHPTSKPLDLLALPIRNSTKENDVVLDLFGGSGSTMMACEQMRRTCYMMEIDEKYASVILRRFAELFDAADQIWCERDGEKVMYEDVALQPEKRKRKKRTVKAVSEK